MQRYVRISLLVTLTMIFGSLSYGDWPQVQNDAARSGYTTAKCGLTASDAVVKWRWRPVSGGVTDKVTSISGRIQPILMNGILTLPMMDGRVFGISATNGNTLWEYQSGGPVLHCTAMDATNVYFGCQDGKIYALNQGNGNEVWTYDTGRPIHNAPLLAEGKVIIGNSGGQLVAVDTATGTNIWSYSTGRPIEITASYGQGKVYCGDEAMYAFAVNVTNGSEIWRQRLQGEFMFGYWPVVQENHNVVYYRTHPYANFHDILASGDNLLDTTGGIITNDGTAADISNEQVRVLGYLGSNVHMRSFWALDMDTGTNKYYAPVLYTAGENSVPIPPIFNPTNDEAWIVGRSQYARYDQGSMVRRYGAEPMNFDPATGLYSLLSTSATANPNAVHLIGDETTFLTADEYGVLLNGRGTLSYMPHTNETAEHVISSLAPGVDDYSHPTSPLAYDAAAGYANELEAGGGAGGGVISGATVAYDAIFWIARRGLLVRVEDQ